MQVYDFKYNKNVKLDDIKLRKILKAEEFGIYIVGYGDTDIARGMSYFGQRKYFSQIVYFNFFFHLFFLSPNL